MNANARHLFVALGFCLAWTTLAPYTLSASGHQDPVAAGGSTPADSAVPARLAALEAALANSSETAAVLTDQVSDLRDQVAELTIRLDRSRASALTAVAALDSVSTTARETLAAEVIGDLSDLRAALASAIAATDARGDQLARAHDSLSLRLVTQRSEMIDIAEEQTALLGDEAAQRQLADQRVRRAVYAGAALLLLALALVAFLAHRRSATVLDRAHERAREGVDEVLRKELPVLEALADRVGDIREALASASSGPPKPDHDLPLKVCNELQRIRNNLAAMDPRVRGHRHLSRAAERVDRNLKGHGYEIVDHMGRKYYPGLKLHADFYPDDALPPGETVISRVVRPEVRFNDQIIQQAKVRVSQGH